MRRVSPVLIIVSWIIQPVSLSACGDAILQYNTAAYPDSQAYLPRFWPKKGVFADPRRVTSSGVCRFVSGELLHLMKTFRRRSTVTIAITLTYDK